MARNIDPWQRKMILHITIASRECGGSLFDGKEDTGLVKPFMERSNAPLF
jgi:hypothetical protein